MQKILSEVIVLKRTRKEYKYDLTLFLKYIILLREDYETLLPAVFLFVGYLIAFALDLTWLIMVSRNLWNNSLYVHDGSLAGLDKFMIIMSYIIIFLEVAAMVICGILFQRGMFTNASDAAQLSTVPLKF